MLQNIAPSIPWDECDFLDGLCSGREPLVTSEREPREAQVSMEQHQQPAAQTPRPSENKIARRACDSPSQCGFQTREVWNAIQTKTTSDECLRENDRPSRPKTDLLFKIEHLLGLVWDKKRLLLGISVCKWMQSELPRRVSTCSLVAQRRPLATSPEMSKCLMRLRDIPMTLTSGHSHGSFLCTLSGVATAAASGFGAHLCKLFLPKNTIRDEEAATLGTVLQSLRPKGLSELDLSANEIGPEGIKALSSAFGALPRLAALDLTRNFLGDAGADSLADGLLGSSALTRLELELNRIGDVGASRLAQLVAMSPSLQRMGLARNYIGDGGARALALALGEQAGGLRELDLRKNKVEDSQSAALVLREGEALRRVDLGDNVFIDAFDPVVAAAGGAGRELVGALGRGRGLTELRMSGTSLEDSGCAALAAALADRWGETLHTLTLSRNGITDEGAEVLSGALGQCAGLAVLDVASNWIGERGAAAIALALGKAGTVEVLEMGGNCIRRAKRVVEGLRGCGGLRELGIGMNRFFQSTGEVRAVAGLLVGLSGLERLGLRSTRMWEEGALALAEGVRGCTALTSLELPSAQLGDRGAAALAAAAAECRGLRVLNMGGADVGDVYAAGAVAGVVRRCAGLEEVELGRNRLSALRLYHHSLLESVGAAPRLRRLGLAGNSELGDAGAERLAEGLRWCRALEEVDLRRCGVSDSGAAALAEALPGSATLAVLRLGGNVVADDGAAALAGSLERGAGLQRLDLAENAVRDRGADALAGGVRRAGRLESLGWWGNPGCSMEAEERLAQACAASGVECEGEDQRAEEGGLEDVYTDSFSESEEEEEEEDEMEEEGEEEADEDEEGGQEGAGGEASGEDDVIVLYEEEAEQEATAEREEELWSWEQAMGGMEGERSVLDDAEWGWGRGAGEDNSVGEAEEGSSSAEGEGGPGEGGGVGAAPEVVVISDEEEEEEESGADADVEDAGAAADTESEPDHITISDGEEEEPSYS